LVDSKIQEEIETGYVGGGNSGGGSGSGGGEMMWLLLYACTE
jgi:hypothetical protein